MSGEAGKRSASHDSMRIFIVNYFLCLIDFRLNIAFFSLTLVGIIRLTNTADENMLPMLHFTYYNLVQYSRSTGFTSRTRSCLTYFMRLVSPFALEDLPVR